MALMTPAQYRASLNDGREIYIRGERVSDMTRHEWFKQAIEVCAADYVYDDPATRDIRLYRTEEGNMAHRVFQVPKTEQDLQAWMDLPDVSSAATMVSLVLMAMWNVKGEVAAINPKYAENIERIYRHCRDNDLRAAELITDAKGDRSRRPSDQDDPDLYMRIVERNDKGIVVRGAKLHITAASMVHELVVLPTKAMSPGEEDYAVAFAVPANTKGVKIINRAFVDPDHGEFDYPRSTRKGVPDGFVVFEDVFVPWERVFLAGETQLAGVYAHSLGLWERVGGLIEFSHRAKRMVGMAALLAEWNGVAGASHIQEKIGELIFNAETLRLMLDAARRNYKVSNTGMVYPDPVAINVGKYHAATTFNQMVRVLHDIAGGLVITMPVEADLRNPELRPYLEKYLHTRPGVSVEDRMRLYSLVRDCTADAYGGWELVTTVQAGGGLAAQRIVVQRSYDMESAKHYAKVEAGIIKE